MGLKKLRVDGNPKKAAPELRPLINICNAHALAINFLLALTNKIRDSRNL